MTETYNPEISALLAQCEDDWGDVEENRKLLVPYGYKQFDKALYGLNTVEGELILVQGQEKNRKTTFVINTVLNYMLAKKSKGEEQPMTVIDTLESGMTPKRYRDQMISNMATRLMVMDGHKVNAVCPACGKGNPCSYLNFTPEFLRYNKKSPTHKRYIKLAIEEMMDWRIHIYGASNFEGDTRNLKNINSNKESRWLELIHKHDAKIFIVDHLQQFHFDNDSTSDYEKQVQAVSAIGSMTAKYNIVTILLSQLSLTSVREARAGMGKRMSSGGSKAAAESAVIITVSYKQNSGEIIATLEDSRRSGTFAISCSICDVSGAYFGVSNIVD